MPAFIFAWCLPFVCVSVSKFCLFYSGSGALSVKIYKISVSDTPNQALISSKKLSESVHDT